MERSTNHWLRQLGFGMLVAIPAGIVAAFLRRYVGLLLAANEYRRALLDHAVDGMVVIDDQDRILTFNPAAEQIFGYRAAEINGLALRTIVAPPDHVMHRLLSIGYAVNGIRKDGTLFPMDMTSGKMQLQGRNLYLLIMRDSTRRKHLEDDLRKARDAAEAASRAKSAMLLTMSHELRTPLNHIIGYSEIVREELEVRDQTDLVPDMLRIDSASRQLLAQIEMVLELAMLESGAVPIHPAPIQIRTLVDAALNTLHSAVERQYNQIILDIAPAIMVTADPDCLRQVIGHILNNANKFTEHGTIAIRTGQTASQTLLSIADTGIGMNAEQVAALFEPFQVADVTTRRQGGAGLGMAIVDRLCRLMGITITVTSEPGRGTTVVLAIPHQYEQLP